MAIKTINQIQMARPLIGDEEIAGAEAVLRSGQISDGEFVRSFEKEFARYTGTEHAVAVNSGTAAIYIALAAHGIGPGDEVITSPFTFIATANAVLLAGARPVFADILPDTFNIDPVDVINKITPNTKALLPVHLYGQACNMDALMEIAGHYRLAVIEDACQAHGAEYRGKKAGSFGTGCFSFYPTKNMTTGEGGIITIDDAGVAERATVLRNHGQTQRYYHEVLGYNYRMTNIAGAIGLSQLKKLPSFNQVRAGNAASLSEGLRGIPGLVLPVTCPEAKHVFHQYTVRLTEDFPVSRDAFRDELRRLGTATEVYYPRPVHRQPVYRKLGYHDSLPEAERAAREVVSLPVHPGLGREDLGHIIESIRGLV